MITAKGAGVLTAAVGIYLLARSSQIGWLYLVDAIFWGALAVALVMPWIGVVFISARRSASPVSDQKDGGRLYEGDRVKITISLKNRLFYPRFFDSVLFDSPLAGPDGAVQRFFVPHLPGSETMLLESTVEAYQRGQHHLGPLTLESSAPFGLFRRRRALTGPQPMLVLPRVYPLDRMTLVDGQDGRSAKSRVSRNALDPAGSRPYVHGDSRRMVHWRNTARAGRPMVKVTEEQTDQALHIMFDSGEVWGEGRDTNFEFAIKLAITVADYALKNGVPVRVWGGNLRGAYVSAVGSAGEIGRITLTWPELLEALAIALPTGPAAMGEGLANLPMGANLFIVLSRGDGPAHESLGRALERSGESVVVRLQGFGEPPATGDAAKSLERAGTSVLTCRPGGLAETISEIESLGQRNAPRASIRRLGAPAGRTPPVAGGS